ncbi:hypothetical protein AK88_01905 [Plasmodium fragile]|uniref:Uncharacterized protein n=1 Tax=Plasmodium fragile TaxID=5857 RepID=A0A0D9QND8_PLAFR|nr:uncharacterized protein AK88_01905 [Plasmodium fragile]KJP88453.1 hypothetical protein AK88_01905 [Plasmodium fragile]
MLPRIKLKRQVLFAKEKKFSQVGCCRFIITNRELKSKLKNNTHLVRLIKHVIPSEEREKSMSHEDEGQIIHLGFSYLYKNVTINKVGRRKGMWYEAPGQYNDDVLTYFRNENSMDGYHEVVVSHHAEGKKGNKFVSRGNIKEVYSYVINSLTKLTPQQVLLTLHSFIMHGVQVEHLIKINDHVINNIYNFKTSELILIHLFYIYFEGNCGNGVAGRPIASVTCRDGVAHRDAVACRDEVTGSEPPFGKEENYYHYEYNDGECSPSLHITKHAQHKIRTVAKELTRYTSHLFYKRRQQLLLNQIEEILFIWSKYNLCHKELFDPFLKVIERSMESLQVNNMESILKGESSPLIKIRKESLHDLNNFDAIIKCFYHLSGVREITLLDETRLKYFSKFGLFLWNNFALLAQLPLHKLFMLLQVGEHIYACGEKEKRDRLQCHLFSLIEGKLKQTNPDHHCGRRTCPQEASNNEAKCVRVLDAVRAYYADMCNSNSQCMGVKQPPACGITDQSCENVHNVGETNRATPTHASLPNMSKTGNAVDEPKNCTRHADGSHVATHQYGGDQIGVLNCPPNVTFLSSINEYIAVGSEPCKKYLPTLLSILKGQKKFQHMVLYFINHVDNGSGANVLIPFIKLTHEYVNNIYALSYMGYLYKCAITSKDLSNRANLNAEKVVVLLSTLHRRIRSDYEMLHGGERNGNPPNVSPNAITFHQHNEIFLASLRASNPNVYEHVQANLLNLNLKEIKKLDEFLFHYVYKHVVNDTFEYLENIIPYMNSQPLVNHLLWLFVQINNYYSVYSNEGKVPRGEKIATLFFQKICILNFLKIYQDKNDNCYEAVKNILTYVRLQKDVDKALSNYVLNLYFKKYIGPFGHEAMYVYITDMLQKLANCNCVLTFQHDDIFLTCSNEKTDRLGGSLLRSQVMPIINTLVQNNCCAHLINFLLLVNARVSFSTLFAGLRNHLYSYAF